jgi:predicted tellurium resistance membrane protein TerC
MQNMIAWLRRMHRDYGPAVGIIAALVLLLGMTLLLTAVITVIGALMRVNPYLALAAALLATAYMVIKKY